MKLFKYNFSQLFLNLTSLAKFLNYLKIILANFLDFSQ